MAFPATVLSQQAVQVRLEGLPVVVLMMLVASPLSLQLRQYQQTRNESGRREQDEELTLATHHPILMLHHFDVLFLQYSFVAAQAVERP